MFIFHPAYIIYRASSDDLKNLSTRELLMVKADFVTMLNKQKEGACVRVIGATGWI